MLAEYAVLSEEALVLMPSHLSFEEATTLPCAAVTAWVALTRDRHVTAGDTVLTRCAVFSYFATVYVYNSLLN